MELALRFLIFKRIDPNEVKSTTDLSEYVTDKMRELATDSNFDFVQEELEFVKTFEILDFILGENVFKKFDPIKSTFSGRFLISGFEAIAYGLGRNITKYSDLSLNEGLKENLIGKIKSIWSNTNFQARSGSGMPVTIELLCR